LGAVPYLSMDNKKTIEFIVNCGKLNLPTISKEM
jgi:hypothetical protein